jgi:cyclohexadienyl dehydratase
VAVVAAVLVRCLQFEDDPMRRRIKLFLCLLPLILWINSAHADDALQDGPSLVRDVFALLDARLALMPDVAAAKWIAQQPVTDPSREAVVIRSAGDAAARRGLARAPVDALFAYQMALARETQSTLIGQWSRDGRGPTTARSLREDLRPAIDHLTDALLRSLALAAPYLATADLAAAARVLPSERWGAEDRKTLFSLLRAVHLEAPRSPARVLGAGVLRVGVPGDYAPFARNTDGHLVGVDVDLTRRLAESKGLEPVYIRSSWATLLDDLEADRFDVAAGGISMTPGRRARAAFSRPLVTGGKTAIGRCTDRDRLNSMERIDQAEVRVIENPGGTNESFARRTLSRAQLTIHPENLTIFKELVEGRADVMYTDDVEIAHMEHVEPKLCRLLDTLFEPTEKALLLPQGREWADLIGDALDRELDSGSYRRSLDEAIRH